MIFSTGLKKIYESIKKQPKDKQKSLYNQLQEKIVSNPVLAYKFNLLESIESKKQKFDKDSATSFVAGLKTEHGKFLKENSSVAIFYKEEKKLFEYFNISQSDVVSSKLDLIVNKKNNELNENLIIEYITDNRLMSGKDRLKSTQNDIKRQLAYAKKNGSDNILDRQFEAIERKSKKLSAKKRTLVEASLKAVKEESFKNFGSACDKTYKLRMITEKLLVEAPPVGNGAPVDMKKQNKLMDKQEEMAQGKKFDMPNLKYIKNIKIEVPDLFKKETQTTFGDNTVVKDAQGNPRETWAEEETTETVDISFNIVLYPKFAKLSQVLSINTGMPALEKGLVKLKRTFMNKFIYQKNINILDPIDSIWTVDESTIPKNLNPEGNAGSAPQQIAANGFYWVAPRIEAVIKAGKAASAEKYKDVAYEILKEFNDYLPSIEFLADILTPEAQQELLMSTPKGRSKEYGDRTGANQYYRDTHGEQSDKHSDLFLGGESPDTEVEDFNMEPYSSKKKGGVEDFDFNLDDEEADKAASAAAKKGAKGMGI